MTSINIPDGVTSIGDDVFSYVSTTECTLYVPENSIGTYKSTSPWSSFTNIVSLQATDINSIKATGDVKVTSNGDQITINGTTNGETIEVYSVAGSMIKSVKAGSSETTIGGLTEGNVYIVKIGGTKVKVAM